MSCSHKAFLLQWAFKKDFTFTLTKIDGRKWNFPSLFFCLEFQSCKETTVMSVASHCRKDHLEWREVAHMTDHTEIIWKPLEPSGSIKTGASTGAASSTQRYCGRVRTPRLGHLPYSDGKDSPAKRVGPGGPGEVMATTTSTGDQPCQGSACSQMKMPSLG